MKRQIVLIWKRKHNLDCPFAYPTQEGNLHLANNFEDVRNSRLQSQIELGSGTVFVNWEMAVLSITDYLAQASKMEGLMSL